MIETDYSRLPREELIKEILVWRNRCIDQQIVYVDDLQVYIDKQVAEHKAYYDHAAIAAYDSAKKYDDLTKSSEFGFSSTQKEFKKTINVRQNDKWTIPNLRKAILDFLGGKHD